MLSRKYSLKKNNKIGKVFLLCTLSNLIIGSQAYAHGNGHKVFSSDDLDGPRGLNRF